MGGVTERCDTANRPVLQRFTVSQAPFKKFTLGYAVDQLNEVGLKACKCLCKFCMGCRRCPSFFFPLAGLNQAN